MRKRCNNKNRSNYHNYGGKGVRVCQEWDDFRNFMRWSFENGYYEQVKDGIKKGKLSIDRINSNGNYEPNNCRWILFEENAIKSCKENPTRYYTYFGTDPDGRVHVFENITEFSKKHGLDRSIITKICRKEKHYNTHKGWTFTREPINKDNKQ